MSQITYNRWLVFGLSVAAAAAMLVVFLFLLPTSPKKLVLSTQGLPAPNISGVVPLKLATRYKLKVKIAPKQKQKLLYKFAFGEQRSKAIEKPEFVLDTTRIPTGKNVLSIQVENKDGTIVISKQIKTVKRPSMGITAPQLGRPAPNTDPNDTESYHLNLDPRFAALHSHYFRIFLSWERLEPGPGKINFDADLGGGWSPPGLYRAKLKTLLRRIHALGMEPIVTFNATPCWAQPKEAWPQITIQKPTVATACTINAFGRFPNSNPGAFPDPYREVVPGQTGMDAYQRFVTAFLGQFSSTQTPANERVRLYTAWNEPNYFAGAQPQRCAQSHPAEPGKDFSNFKNIPCPPGVKPDEIVSDIYYSMLYKRLDEAISHRQDEKLDEPEIILLGGDTADSIIEPDNKSGRSIDEAKFTRRVLKLLQREGINCPRGPWATHGYHDISEAEAFGSAASRLGGAGKLEAAQRLVNVLDSQKESCWHNLQIWVTEGGALYQGNGQKQAQQLDAFLASFQSSNLGRRIDVFVQYLFQTDPNFDSGLLSTVDANGDGNPDTRETYNIFKKWSKTFSTGQRPAGSRSGAAQP